MHAQKSAFAALVRTDRYPVDRPDSAEYSQLIESCRAQLAADGCAHLPDFLTESAAREAREQTRRLAPEADFAVGSTNPYFTAEDPELPATDPRRIMMERSCGFVAWDRIPRRDVIQRLYLAPEMKAFVAACLGYDAVHEYADPLAGLIVNVLPGGSQQPWHFDTNEFIVSLMTQEPEAGGEFDYSPGIRSPEDENFSGVARVCRGEDTASVKTLRLRPGDLQLFKGRFTVHQVRRVQGATDRLTAILAYSEKPGMIGRLERTRQLFGRVCQEHLDAEARRVRADGLVD